jgi:hypothetical protein
MKSILIVFLCFTSVLLNDVTFSMGAATFDADIAAGGNIPISAIAQTSLVGTITIEKGGLVLKKDGTKEASITCTATLIGTTATSLTCTTDTKLDAVAGASFVLDIGDESKIVNEKDGSSNPKDSGLVFKINDSAKTFSSNVVNPQTNTITFNLVSLTYNSEIAATTGEIKIKATSTANTEGTVTVVGGLTLTKTGGNPISLNCAAAQIKTSGTELTCNPSAKIEAASGNVYNLAVLSDASKFTHESDANLSFALGNSKTFTYSTQSDSPSNPNEQSSSAFSYKLGFISLLLCFLF